MINRFGTQGIFLVNSDNNVIEGNFIGTDVTGTIDLGNTREGVLVFAGSSGNTIGGTTDAARNLISGNNQQGVSLCCTDDTAGNMVHGNLIGTDKTGTADLGNSFEGVIILQSPGNTVGGDQAGEGNVISGNNRGGVLISGVDAMGNTVQSNFIGTNAAGTAALGNTSAGVKIDGAPSNTIGGSTAAARNVISGNTTDGVSITGVDATGNMVKGNYIGTNAAGTEALGNTGDGVNIDGAPTNFIGGDNATPGGECTGACNLISGNGNDGVLISGSNATSNLVIGNYIGTDFTGTAPIGNTNFGVEISGSAGDNTIGGDTAEERNVISGNNIGVLIRGAMTTGNMVEGNYIGTNALGTGPVANDIGVDIISATGTIVEGNLISGNVNGLAMESGATGTMVEGNFIGTNALGTVPVANTLGVVIINSPGNTIGGTGAAARNIISGNTEQGILIQSSGATGNVVQGNFIGTNITGTLEVGNGDSGVEIRAPGNTIGGMNPTAGETCTGACNLISGNGTYGVSILGSSSMGNMVKGNFIGTKADGTGLLGNDFSGVLILNSPMNTIGGTVGQAANVIAFNRDGVEIVGLGATANSILGNYLGTNTVEDLLGNTDNGVNINGAPSNDIGGTDAGEANIIANNGNAGVRVLGSNATGNTIRGNSIFDNGAGGGIQLVSGGNEELEPPIIVFTGSAGGTTCPNCTVHVYSDGANEGKDYEGEADPAVRVKGQWLWTFPGAVGGPNITATSTDLDGNTSEFSLPIAKPFNPCADVHPEVTINTIAKGQSAANNAKVEHDITGNVIGGLAAYPPGTTASRIELCEGTTVSIVVTDTTGGPLAIVAPGAVLNDCGGTTCTLTYVPLVATQKYTAVSSDGSDTDRLTLLPVTVP